MNNKIIDINKKSYIGIVCILASLIILAIAITYFIPKGQFGTTTDEFGNIVTDFNNFIELEDLKGINILKGIFAPILVLFSGDGLSIFMLSLFLLVVAGAFQVMSDSNGMNVIVYRVVNKFKNNKKLLVSLITLVFMLFGSLLGLFEEVLTLLPLIVMLSISLGFDGYTGFLMCILACGFGFASALTNPFTVITASDIIGVSPMNNIWFRIIIFIIMYGLILTFIFVHIKRIEKNPLNSPTYETDQKKKESLNENLEVKNEKKIFNTYIIFLSLLLLSIITITSIDALRSYTIVFLIAIFLIGGLIAGYIANENFKNTLNQFLKGLISALPTILLVLMASSIKYILEEGNVIATIAHTISNSMAGKNVYAVAILIFLIILVLEFFISSSTAKAIFVMGILSVVNISLSKELLVLLYVFGDGYTNVLFPTSPVLLIALSMVGINYFTWLRKSKFLFLINFLLVIGFIALAILIKY